MTEDERVQQATERAITAAESVLIPLSCVQIESMTPESARWRLAEYAALAKAAMLIIYDQREAIYDQSKSGSRKS